MIMKSKVLALISFFVISLMASAQRPAPDKIETGKGVLTIQPIYHATMVLTWDGKTIYVDPHGNTAAFKGLEAPDIILITDIHGDHLDLKALRVVTSEKAIIIAPKSVVDKLPKDIDNKAIVTLNNGENTAQLGIPIEAIPMYNLPEEANAMHTKGRGNGYILTFADKRLYISGDTEDIAEMRALKNIDIAFVCMNLPYTMDVDQAASAVLEFKPKIVYAFHYRGKAGFSDVEAFKKQVNDKDKLIEVRLRNWYPEY